jgi:Na+/H+ antiporter
MDSLEVVLIALFISVAGLNALATWLNLPYPILLVLGGIALAAVPGLPDVELEPELVLIIFLPPLLYSAAFFADLPALRRDARAVSMASIGIVLTTTAVVAVVAHEVIGIEWGLAFALGAIVSPTDPVAATAIMRRLGMPRRLVNLIEGESLVNDATALVAYKVAVAAAVGGSFSLLNASGEFVLSAFGGVAVGLAVAWVVTNIRKRLNDMNTELTISLFTGYAAYLPAEELGLSGVLAAVVCGLYVGWHGPEIASPETRLQGQALWGILGFLLNATLFVLIGLQLPVILDELETPFVEACGYAVLISATVIAVRFAWLFTVPYVIRVVDRRDGQVERRVGARERIVVGWSGMRGGVSLAAALALPLQTDAGAELADRDLILFITYGVILATVVGQGLTLPTLIRSLGVSEDGSEEEQEEVHARLVAAKAALACIDDLEQEDWTLEDTIDRVRGQYRFRKRRFAARTERLEDDGIEERSMTYQRMMHLIYEAQRNALVELRNDGQASAEIIRRIERELDLEETRLDDA